MEESLNSREEKIIRFWRDRGIFRKSLTARRRAKPFRFFEGPPTANAAPGFHHALARVYKDLVCRWKTMEGFYVERKAGWDTHGLPVELQIEKELGIKHKSEIERFGVAEFNKKAKESVWRYKNEWEKFTERLGYWLDMADPYITYDSKYMETLWWIFKKIWQKGLLEKDYKVVPYCPRCETPLSSHEVAQGYATTRDPSVYLRLRLRGTNEYLLVWTTTPWTLPANVAVAVNPKATYTKYRINNEFYWSVKPPPHANTHDGEAVEKRSGKALVGLDYEPIFRVNQKLKAQNPKLFSMVAGDFVETEEGTGFVHIAPAFGEEDLELSRKEDLPVIMNVSASGRFDFPPEALRDEPFFSAINGKFVKDADPVIFEELKIRRVLWDGDLKGTEHEYPFCWRCGTPLLYYAHESWFVRMSKIKDRVLANNRKINWIPSHLKEGRFGEWLRELKDWAISRERYWGTPLPIWICEKCAHVRVIGSLTELCDYARQPNTFYFMRHGQADHNVKGYIAGWPEKPSRISRLTPKGRAEVEKAGRELAKKKIDIIITSDLERMKETAGILKRYLKRAEVIYEPRLRELNTGIFNYRTVREYNRSFKNRLEKFSKRPVGGENLDDSGRRYFEVIHGLNLKHRGKKILVVGHGDPLWAAEGRLLGLSPREILTLRYPRPGEWHQAAVPDLPYNDEAEVDLHRPYVDAIRLECPKCAGEMLRVKEVADVWYDSGAMPFAQWHYPFENRDKIEKKLHFPADYIAEAVDQTRGWFYTLHAVATLLGKGPAYLNVISTGHILDEKGEKMSKSKGNIVDPWQMFEKYGADSVRWYLVTVNAPGDAKRFSERDLAKTHQDLLILYNILNFWETYSPRKVKIQSSKAKNVLDGWIVAKLAQLIGDVRTKMDAYEIVGAARAINTFFTEDLSRWYVRRSRRRFQRPENQRDLAEASALLGYVLRELARLMAAFVPFTAEHIWQAVRRRLAGRALPESVHLTALPSPVKLAGSKAALVQGDAVRQIAALALKARAESGIKVRQPLEVLEILQLPDSVRLSAEWLAVLADEINVKNVKFVRRLSEGASWQKRKEGGWQIGLNTYLTSQLKAEGTLRELIRNIQEGRQALNLNPRDRIMVWVSAPRELNDLIERSQPQLKRSVGAKIITLGKTEKFHFHKDYQIEGRAVGIAIRKIS